MSNTIHIPIQAEHFEHILNGKGGDYKQEEYRAITPYWTKRLCRWVSDGRVPHESYKDIAIPIEAKAGKKTVTLTNGYGNHRPRAVIELLGLAIRKPNPDWCPPEFHGQFYFALQLGKVLSTENIAR